MQCFHGASLEASKSDITQTIENNQMNSFEVKGILMKTILSLLFCILLPSLSYSQDGALEPSLITIYVDKAPAGTTRTAQNLHVYHRDSNTPIMFSITSTGRENTSEKSYSGQQTDSITPVGRFGVTRMSIDHVSTLWTDAAMPYAIFFHKGYALHGVHEWAYADLGSRASGGCVRLPIYMAAQLWDIVIEYGPENVAVVIYDSTDMTKPLPRYFK